MSFLSGLACENIPYRWEILIGKMQENHSDPLDSATVSSVISFFEKSRFPF
jgi:hypothetical protein